jgi:regulatory protein
LIADKTRAVNAASKSMRQVALGLLLRRDYASGELGQALMQRGGAPAEIESLIDELREDGMLDDARFVANFVRQRSERGQGPVRIAMELRSRQLSEELIDLGLAVIDWADRARYARQRKFGASQPLARVERARQARFLQYRGFSADHIRTALGASFDPD